MCVHNVVVVAHHSVYGYSNCGSFYVFWQSIWCTPDLPFITAVVVLSQQLTVQKEFCSALEQLAATPASPGLQCTASDCTTLACTSNMGAVSVQFQILFSVCSDPPSLDTVIIAGGRMFINQKVEHSQVITTPFFDANLTFDQLDNAIAFQVHVHAKLYICTIKVVINLQLPYNQSNQVVRLVACDVYV